MTGFVPYPKVPVSVGAWALTEAETRQAAKIRWVATEKIHGAHLCVRVGDDGVELAKRRSPIEAGDDFFSCRAAIGPLLAAFRRLSTGLRDGRARSSVLVYGELFGGHYPHPDVEPTPGVQAVQTGVHYCPDIRFLAFDLGVSTNDGGLDFVPFDEARDCFERAGIPTVPVCGVGSLTEMMAIPTSFATLVPTLFGLPAIAENLAEGVVVKPADGSLAGPTRLKRKTPAFAETRYHEARPWPPPTGRGGDDDALTRIDETIASMLTANRIDSAISKIGRPRTAAARAAIAAEVTRDIQLEIETQAGAALLALPSEDRALLWSLATAAIAEEVDKHAATERFDDSRYLTRPALAFIRGRLPDADDGSTETLLAAAEHAELRLHKFKRKSGPPRVTAVLSILEGLDAGRLLDIGSGRGAFLWPLLDRFPELEVTAIDVLPHRVRDIEAVRRGGIERLAGSAADVAALPWDADAFDVVTILEVLEHLPDPVAAAAEVVRVAREFVIASVPSTPDDNPEHIRLFTADSLSSLFMAAGARRVQLRYVRNHMIAIVRCAADEGSP